MLQDKRKIKTAEQIKAEGVAWLSKHGMGASPYAWEVDDPIHTWFELSYAQYLTIPRSALQSMPREWQVRFVKCLEELDRAIDWRPENFTYWVKLRTEDGKLISAEHDPLCDYERGRRQLPLTRV